jgi:hypothetical protein
MQQDESFEMQNQSRMLEPSPAPRMGRPTPFTVVGKRVQDIDGSHNLDQIKAHLDVVIDDETMLQEYIQLISNVMERELKPIAPEEYEQLFGGAYSPKLLPVVNILFESFQHRFSKEDVDTAFEYACRAYLAADPDILSELERYEDKEPNRLYVIARLMRHFLTFPFDRTHDMHLGGKKSRSKKRGRKSVHRRKKSIHKKRKSKKN